MNTQQTNFKPTAAALCPTHESKRTIQVKTRQQVKSANLTFPHKNMALVFLS